MCLKLYLPLIMLITTASFSLQAVEEKLPNNLHIVYNELDRTPISEEELTEIEQDINQRIRELSIKFKEQTPQQNISDLHQLKEYINTNYRYKKMIQYRIANTPLNSAILLLSNLLNVLPGVESFDPKYCRLYINRLTIRAQVSVNSDNLHKWIDQILDLLPYLCIKDT